MPELVVDASALVDLLVGGAAAPLVAARLRGHAVQAPAHVDAEVLSALGRLHRAGQLSARAVRSRLDRLASIPIQRHLLPPLLETAWHTRANLRLSDGLYAALGDQLGVPVITTDRRFAATLPSVELVAP